MKSTLQLLRTLLFLFFIIISNKIYSQAGTLDSSFGTGGLVLTNFNSYVSGTNVRVTKDNKLILAGTLPDNITDSIFISKYNLYGTIIKSFGNNGVVKYKGFQADTKIDEQNRILIVGSEPDTTLNSIISRSILLRFKPNGTIDSNFGFNGKTLIKIKSNRSFIGDEFNVYHVANTANKKIIVTGAYAIGRSDTDEFAIAIAQYKSNGSIDSGFGNNGQKLVWFNLNRITPLTLTVQPDGKILIGGQLLNFKNAKEYFTLVRLNSNGAIDSSFGMNGIVITAVTNYNFLRSTAIQNNKIIAAGDIGNNPSKRNQCIIRYNINGEIDTTFGNNGRVITSLPSSSLSGSDIIINPDNKIILLSSHNLITRYTANGSMDTTFGDKGFDSISFYKYSSFQNFSIQNDNKIVIAGHAYLDTPFYSPTIFITRINNNVELPATSLNTVKEKSSALEFLQTGKLNKLISIYPNPANNLIYIEGLKEGIASTISITDTNGKKLLTTHSLDKINIQNLANGVYYINITQNGETTKQKFIKQ